MASATPMDRKRLEKFLRINGFDQNKTHHRQYEKTVVVDDIKISIKTYISHSKHVDYQRLQKNVLDQLGGLSLAEFNSSVDNKTTVDYVKHLTSEQEQVVPVPDYIVKRLTKELNTTEEVIQSLGHELALEVLNTLNSMSINAPVLQTLKHTTSLDEYRARIRNNPELDISKQRHNIM